MAQANQPSKQELKRSYKEQPVFAGVFAITNLTNQKTLLGSSKNLHGPLNRHRFALKLGGHDNKALQQDWKQLGEASFRFEIVAQLEPVPESAFELEEALEKLEQQWVERLQPLAPNGYNTSLRLRE